MNIILAIISGILVGISFPTVFGSLYLPNFGFLMWVALVPLFCAIREMSAGKAFRYTLLTVIIYHTINFFWIFNALKTYGELGFLTSFSLLILLIVMMSLYLAIAVSAAVWVEKRVGVNRFWLIPVFWMAIEFTRNYTPFGGFSWANLSSSQYAYLPLIQISDIIGSDGFVLLIVMFNMLIAGLIVTRKVDRIKTITTLLLVALTVTYGYVRLYDIDKKQNDWPFIKVATLQGNVPQEIKGEIGNEKEILAPYQRFMFMLEDSNADLIIWPESTYPWLIPKNTHQLPAEHFGRLYDGSLVLFGGLTSKKENGRRQLWNSAYLMGQNGQLLDKYHKYHLVPFGEYLPWRKFLFFARPVVQAVGDFNAGKEIKPLLAGTFKIGPLVCYEDTFPEVSRKMAKNGANLLANITNDAWYGRTSAAYQHVAMAVFRSIETRRWMVRSANSGVSAVIDAAGRVVAGTGIFESGMIVSNVRLSSDESLYVKFGEWFAWLGLAVMALFIGWAGYMKFRK